MRGIKIMINNLNEKDFKLKVRVNYNSVVKMDNFKKARKDLVKVNEYINNLFYDMTSDIDYKTSNFSLDKEFINIFNLLFDMIINEKSIVEKWNGLSNTKKKHVIINNMLLFTLTNTFKLDREKSVYNKDAKQYIEKVYNDTISVRLFELFLQVAKTLNKIN